MGLQSSCQLNCFNSSLNNLSILPTHSIFKLLSSNQNGPSNPRKDARGPSGRGTVFIPQCLIPIKYLTKFKFNKPYKLHEVPTPGKDLHEDDMLVKVAVGSLCHTDGMVSAGHKTPLHRKSRRRRNSRQNGSAIKEFEVGDRILCSLQYHRCNTCLDCLGPERDTQYCANIEGYLGVTRDGSFAEYELVDGRECYLLPGNVSFQSAAPLACAGNTIIRIDPRPNTFLVVSLHLLHFTFPMSEFLGTFKFSV
jgi:hypothetical protein